jgi:hypothetical protein
MLPSLHRPRASIRATDQRIGRLGPLKSVAGRDRSLRGTGTGSCGAAVLIFNRKDYA